ncbi:hypothetical protein [Spirulina subsalsa]|uniref:hypothetical protein n=1 Tax=Spirulina subsalsa TaxID=54311 RepID=UPI000303ACD5|nr:hypothetical protein [Spirulina subsalsa]
MSLAQAIHHYQQAILEINADLLTQVLQKENVAKVLTARDAVQQQLDVKDHSKVSGSLLITLEILDYQLQEVFRELRKRDHNLDELDEWFDQWRAILKPAPTYWWWFQAPSDSQNGILRLLSIICLTGSSAIWLSLIPKILVSGTGLIGIMTILINSLLPLGNAGILAKNLGQEKIERLLRGFRLQNRLHSFHTLFSPEHKLGPAKPFSDRDRFSFSLLTLLCSILFVELGSAHLAHFYFRQASEAYEKKQFRIALEKYELSLRLNPDNPKIYLQLGNINHELVELDAAIRNYKIAVQSPDCAATAAASLASIYLAQKDYSQADNWLWKSVEDARKASQAGETYIITDQQFKNLEQLLTIHLNLEQNSQALRWINLGLGGVRNHPEKEYTLLTSLGRIQLKSQANSEAKFQLQKAIDLQPNKALAYCLMAEALGLEGLNGEATVAWEQCSAKADQTNPEEYQYQIKARSYLAEELE